MYLFVIFPWYYFFNVIMRLILEDWSFNRGYFFLNSVDPNRFINWDWFPMDPYDFDYWSTQEFGVDCNGNMGKDLYCYCSSQGYNCGCNPVEWFESTSRLECYDHIGVNCDGDLVEGETGWCRDPSSSYYMF